eukprot:951760-Karenia_brevis.AAC.1
MSTACFAQCIAWAKRHALLNRIIGIMRNMKQHIQVQKTGTLKMVVLCGKAAIADLAVKV